jgi:hypothetical protein
VKITGKANEHRKREGCELQKQKWSFSKRVRAFGAPVVDLNIDTTKSRCGLVDQVSYIILEAHICADELCLGAERAQLRDQLLPSIVMSA